LGFSHNGGVTDTAIMTKAQTTLIWFVVDLLTGYTTNPQQNLSNEIEMLTFVFLYFLRTFENLKKLLPKHFFQSDTLADPRLIDQK